MLTRKELVQRAILHFPRWMDIRKRYYSSSGGQLISSLAHEVASIQDEINLYVEQFFIPYYEDKCDIIPDFVYKANIGIVDLDKVELVNPALSITDDIKTFYTQNIACYQNGIIFIKDKIDTLFYKIDGYMFEANAEKIHVWNVYDEFATFIGIKRFENETNQELYNRILNTGKKVINSSEQGLKNAITASLINIVPELSDEDIIIEKPTAKNLSKQYDEFNTILTKLIEVNKDVLKTKKWDMDKWNYDFKEISYVSNEWDIPLNDYTNGIGDNDDLKLELIDNTSSTDLDLSFYKKSEAAIEAYIKNQDIDDVLNLYLTKYNDFLEPYLAEYTIKASEAIEIEDIDDKPISFELYETVSDEHYRTIESLITTDEDLKDVYMEDTGMLEADKYYKVKFIPKNSYDSMEIYDCYVLDENGNIATDENNVKMDFKREKGNFVLSSNTLKNDLVKMSLSKLSQFNQHANMIDTGAGVTIDKINNSGRLTVATKGLSRKTVKVLYDCEMTNVLEHNIELNNFFYNKETNTYLSEIEGDEKTITVSLEANQFSMTLVKGQCNIIAFIDGEKVYEGAPMYDNEEYKFTTSRYDEPKNMQIIIIGMGFEQVEISKLLYNKYVFNVATKDGEIMKRGTEDNLYVLPLQMNNEIYLDIITYTQFAPIIKKVFIGTPLTNSDSYESDLIKCSKNSRLVIHSNCSVELYESTAPFDVCSKNNEAQKVTVDYSTESVYTAKSDDSYIILNLSDYTSIENISVPVGEYEVIIIGNSQRHIVRLKTGQSISGITINGYCERLVGVKTIHELIKKEYSEYSADISDDGMWADKDKIYASKLLKCFIVEKANGEQSKLNLSINSFGINHTNVSKVIVSNLSDDLQIAFESIKDGTGDYITIGTEHNGTFENMYIYPKSAKEYVARNEYIMHSSKARFIDMVNTFNNGFIDNSLMLYVITSNAPDEVEVLFDSEQNWTVGKKEINLSLILNQNFNMVQKVITEDIKLGTTISLKEVYTTENKEKIELAQYVIDSKDADYEVIYKTDVADPSYEMAEYITVTPEGFNKLKYSNIVAIKYIGEEVYEENNILEQIDSSKYALDKEKGIILWRDDELIEEEKKLYVEYQIKKAVAIKFDIDSLYKKVHYPINAYEKVSKYTLANIEDNKKIDLLNPVIGDSVMAENLKNDYINSDTVYTVCSEPGFVVEKNDNILSITKTAATNSLAVKSGWYYMFGKEYYMFSTDQSKNIANGEFIDLQEIKRINGEYHLHKQTDNFVRNSRMTLGTMANTYTLDDFKDVKSFKGISNINALTACDTYNHWITFGMEVSLSKGLNGLGLFFKPSTVKDIDYALLEITDYIPKHAYISYYNPHKLDVYIGEEDAVNNILLTDTVNISSLTKVTTNEYDDIYGISFEKQDNKKYYLVVRGEGLLDDIIAQDSSNYDFESHKKNISKLNLDIDEKSTVGIVSRQFLSYSKGNKNNGTEVDSKGYIINASTIDWNITKIKSYTSKKDWLNNCILTNVDVSNITDNDCIVSTSSSGGNILTKPIYIGDPSTIKSVLYKINNIPLASMQGFTSELLQSKTLNGTYIKCDKVLKDTSNINYVTDLKYPYVQLSVDIPKNKVIDSIEIYIEYKSTDEAAPNSEIEANGTFISKVYDTHYQGNYKLTAMDIADQSGEAEIYIRASKEKSALSVWSSWKKVSVDNNTVINDLIFEDYRFFQIRVDLKGVDSKIKLKYFDLEVVE